MLKILNVLTKSILTNTKTKTIGIFSDEDAKGNKKSEVWGFKPPFQ